MIVWLASYPRSGNTLLRTILRSTLQLNSYTDQGTHTRRILTAGNLDAIGHLDLPKPWPAFYREATASPEVVLVKTHQPPLDDQPALYVVRNGRSAILSYLHYHQNFFPEAGRTLLQLLVGDDAYQDWTSHFQAWTRRPVGRLRLLRFEELIHCSDTLLSEITSFIGVSGAPASWRNPQADLHAQNPRFFGAGRSEWQPPDFWTGEVEAIFQTLHGPQMTELGFQSRDVAEFRSEVALLLRKLAGEKWQLQAVCEQRQRIIEELAAR